MRRRRSIPIGQIGLLLILLALSKQWGALALISGILAVFFLPTLVRFFQAHFTVRVPSPAQDHYGREHEPQPLYRQQEEQPLPDYRSYGWGYKAKPNFFTRSEAAFFHGVRQVLPPDHHIFPKVRLGDLVDIDAAGREKMAAWGRISQKHLDFIICDSHFRPRLAIEIDGRSHQRPRQQESDETKDLVLNVSGLPILRYEVGTTWDFGRIASYMFSERSKP